MDYERVLDDAERDFRGGDLAAAERTLLGAWPDMSSAPPDARHLLGRVRMRQGRLEEAEQFLRSAIRSEPNALRHHIALGHILSAAFNPASAADAYGEALKLDPTWPGLLQRYAHTCYRAGRSAEAERAARELIAVQPMADAWDILSGALRDQNKGKEALAAADEALKLDPNHSSAQHSRGAALAALGRHKEALAIFDAMVKGGATSPRLWLSQAAAMEKLGKKADAAAVLADAGRRWPQHPRVKKALAERGR